MEIVRDDPSARWLPSRHRFALARLIAFLKRRMEERRSRPHAELPLLHLDHLLLAIDRDQSAIENYSIAIWFSLMTVCEIAAVLPLSPALAIAAAIPLAAVAIELPICFGANSFVLMLLQFIACAYFASVAGPVHYVAWFSLALFAVNAAAWIVDRICGI